MKVMTEQQWRAFISEGQRFGKLATVRANGRPHIAPLWFVADGDDIVFTTGIETVKGRNLTRSGHAALLVHDDRTPYRYVSIEGPVTISDDRDEAVRWAVAIARRYVGEAKAEQVGSDNVLINKEVAVRLTGAKVTALDELDKL